MKVTIDLDIDTLFGGANKDTLYEVMSNFSDSDIMDTLEKLDHYRGDWVMLDRACKFVIRLANELSEEIDTKYLSEELYILLKSINNKGVNNMDTANMTNKAGINKYKVVIRHSYSECGDGCCTDWYSSAEVYVICLINNKEVETYLEDLSCDYTAEVTDTFAGILLNKLGVNIQDFREIQEAGIYFNRESRYDSTTNTYYRTYFEESISRYYDYSMGQKELIELSQKYPEVLEVVIVDTVAEDMERYAELNKEMEW